MKEIRNRLSFQYIASVAKFAEKHIQGIDQKTMRWLVELVEISGSGGWVTEYDLLERMRLLRKYVPGSCQYTMLVLAELLELNLPAVVGNIAAVEWLVWDMEATAVGTC